MCPNLPKVMNIHSPLIELECSKVLKPKGGGMRCWSFLAMALVAFLACWSSISQAQTVTTLAGNPKMIGSADGAGSVAWFDLPKSVAVDRSGNVYVADTANNTIRKITPDGAVTTLAGSAGIAGSADGTGTAALFFSPSGVAVDRTGNIYVADTYNFTIRKVTPDGVVTTLAGTAGSQGRADGVGGAARFYALNGVAVDGAGNVYVADDSAIRKITPAGVVTTFAGDLAGASGSTDATGAAARFYGPGGVVVDRSGNVYVADTWNFTIRKITPAGVVTTLAGTAGTQGNLDGTSGAARFNNPNGLSVDGNGIVYVADNNTIRKVTPAGVVTTLAGDLAGAFGSVDGIGTAARFFQPNGVTVDGSGNLYVADTYNSIIRKISYSTSGGVSGSLMVTLSSTNAAVSAGARWQVDGGSLQISAATVSGLAAGVHTIAFSTISGSPKPTNRLVTVQAGGTTAVTENYDDLTSSQQNVITLTGSAAQLNNPNGVAVDGNGYVYVADTVNNTIRKVQPDGTVLLLAGTDGTQGSTDGLGAAALFTQPNGVAVDRTGNVYVADTGNYTIRKITPAGAVTTFAGTAGLQGSVDGTGVAARFFQPTGIAVDRTGNVYVADASTIRKITPAGVVTTFAGTAGVQGSADGAGAAAQFFNATGIAVDGRGYVYVADTYNFTIRKITPFGTVTTLAGSAGFQGSVDGAGNAAEFFYPNGVSVDGAGNIYVSDNNLIRKITSGGVVTTLAGATDDSFGSVNGTGDVARFNNLNGIAVDGGGNMYAADSGNNRIRKISQSGSGGVNSGGTGSLEITISPKAAVNAGAQWQVDGGAWQSSGATVSGLAVGLHFVAFSTVSGYPAPSLRMVSVNAKTTTLVTQSYDISTGPSVTTLAGSAGTTGSSDGTGSSALFNYPNGVVVDRGGNLFVADSANNVIRKITSQGVVSTYAGIPGKTGNIPGASSIDTQPSFNNPNGVAVDARGNIYVADTGYDIIRKISFGGVVTTLAGSVGLTPLISNNTIVAWNVWAIPGSADGLGAAAQFDHPSSLAVDGSGNVYVADSGNNTIRKITPEGLTTTFAGTAGVKGSADGVGAAAQFNYPTGVALDGSGNIYVADSYNFTIRKITPAGVVTTLAGNPGVAGTVDGTGNLAEFFAPMGLTVDWDGNVYVTDCSTIRMVTPAGVVTTLAGDPSGAYGSADGTGSDAGFYFPNGISADLSGNLYVADTGNCTIRKVASSIQTGSTRMISPANGSTLTAADTTFNWSAGIGVSQYSLSIGSTPGASDLYAQNEDTNLSQTVTLPTDGRPLYVNLGSLLNGAWQYATYVYNAFSTGTAVNAQMTYPANNSSLSSALTTFKWNAGTGNTGYALWIGSTPNSYDIYAGNNEGTKLTDTVTLPADGRTIYVSLWSTRTAGGTANYYVFTAPDFRAQMTSPDNNSTLSSAVTTFNWDAGSGISQYALWVGSTPDSHDLYAQNVGANLSQDITLPTDGSKVYVRLWSLFNGTWLYSSYVYTTQAGPVPASIKAQITSQVNGSALSGATTTFSWSGGIGVSGYALWVGSTPGAHDIYAGDEKTDLSKTLTLPTDGRTIYVQLWSLISGEWKQSNTYSYTTTDTRAVMTSPANGSILPSSSTTFNWSAGSGVTEYALWVGSTPGGYDLYSGDEKTNLTKTLALPTDGRPIYVQLWSLMNGTWQPSKTVYTASTCTTLQSAQITSHANGSTLSSAATTFSWSAGSGVSEYALWVGSAPGAYDLFAGDEKTNLSQLVTLPTDGRAIYVRLWSLIGGQWQYSNYNFTALDTRATMTTPVSGSTLAAASTTFNWTAGTGVSGYALWIGSTPGAYDLYAADEKTNLSRTVTLPTDGRPLYVQLWSLMNGSWQPVKYVYTAYSPLAPASLKAQITSQVNGSTLSAAATTLSWSTGTGVSRYALWVGSTPGGNDLWSADEVTNLTQAMTLPTDGRTIYVRLWSLIGGVWQYNTYSYTALDTRATMTTPVSGSTLVAASTTFNWTAGTGVSRYALWVGSAPGAYDLYAGDENTSNSKTLTLPTDGRPIYVQLWSLMNGTWQPVKYAYTAASVATPASVKAQMTSPVIGSSLISASTTFSWSAGVGVTQYALWIGSSPDAYDIYAGVENTLSKTMSLPADGRTIYLRLWSLIGGEWQFNSYTYTAPDTRATMTTPVAGSALTSASTTFNWSAGTGVSEYALWVGSAPGAYDIYAGDEKTNLTKTLKLPTDGRPVYVQLWSLVNGVWSSNKYNYSAY